MFGLAKDEHSRSCEMFILEKNNLIDIDQHAYFESFLFCTFYCDLLPFRRLEVFQLPRNFVNHLLLT